MADFKIDLQDISDDVTDGLVSTEVIDSSPYHQPLANIASPEVKQNAFVFDLQSDMAGANYESESPGSIIDRLRKLVAPVVLAVLVFGVLAIHLLGDSDDLLENIDGFVGDLLPSEEYSGISIKPSRTVEEVPSTEQSSTVVLAPPPVDNDQVGSKDEEIFRNPYWYLPNPLGNHPKPLQGEMGGVAEESYRDGLAHEYVYQSYKAIRDIRKQRLRGAQVILYEGLQHRKFWTRMESLIALAEYGFEVEIATIESVFVGVRPSLIKNYLKRNFGLASPGSLYIAKQAIRLVDDHARLIILRSLSRKNWQGHKLYLAAATYDPSPRIQKWLVKELEKHPLDGVSLASYESAVREGYQDNPNSIDAEPNSSSLSLDTDSKIEVFDRTDQGERDSDEIDSELEKLTEERFIEEGNSDGFKEIGGASNGFEIIESE